MPELVSSRVGKTSVSEHLGFKGEATADVMAKRAVRDTMVAFMMVSAKSEVELCRCEIQIGCEEWRRTRAERKQEPKLCVPFKVLYASLKMVSFFVLLEAVHPFLFPSILYEQCQQPTSRA